MLRPGMGDHGLEVIGRQLSLLIQPIKFDEVIFIVNLEKDSCFHLFPSALIKVSSVVLQRQILCCIQTQF